MRAAALPTVATTCPVNCYERCSIWLVDPEKMTVTVIASGKLTKVLRSEDTLDGGDVLPGFTVQVAEIFA